jgi:tRNA G18 (ribose-2'-O)-methylase SpoU
MPLERVCDLSDPRLADYRHVPDPELLRRGEIFVAEGRLVVCALLADSSFVTRSILVTETALDALRDVIEPRLADQAVYVTDQATIQQVTGFNIHRGCLAIGRRPPRVGLEEFLARSETRCSEAPLVVLEHIVNADNVGGIFRNAAAFGAAAVVLGPNCCDPLYRKAIRTSMGAALRVPFVDAGKWPDALGRLRQAGYTVVALTPRAEALSIDELMGRIVRSDLRRLALLAGSEGPGLSESALAGADLSVRIPMASGVDSLNVATAAAIALHRIGGQR